MRYTNSILLFSRIATAFYFVLLIVNLVVPVLSESSFNVNIFTIIMMIIWTIAILSEHGIFKRVVSKEDGKIIYDTILPILPPTLIRIIEFGWMFLRHRGTFRIGVFFTDVALDIIFIIILIFDKMRYYYEAEESESND